jgi:hypothetical protein
MNNDSVNNELQLDSPDVDAPKVAPAKITGITRNGAGRRVATIEVELLDEPNASKSGKVEMYHHSATVVGRREGGGEVKLTVMVATPVLKSAPNLIKF